jgi:hypothetical protein
MYRARLDQGGLFYVMDKFFVKNTESVYPFLF